MKYNFKYLNEIELPDFQKIEAQQYFRKEPLQVEYVKDGVVLPTIKNAEGVFGGVIDARGNYVEQSSEDLQTERICNSYQSKEVFEDDRTVIYMGLYKKHWGYFITNIVTRLWYLLREQDISKVWIAYTIIENGNWNNEIEGNFWEYFEILGLRREQLILIDKPIRFQEVIIPEHAHVPGKYFTQEFKEFYDYLKSKVTLDKPIYEKIYFTRRGNARGDAKDYGEKQFTDIFQKAGYQIVEPEGKSLREQIWLLKNCKHIACVSGTLMHNLLFASDGIEMIVLNRQGVPMLSHEYQATINQMREVTATHIDASLRILPINGAGPNIYYLTRNMCRFLEDRGMQYKHPDYKRNSLKNHLVLIWYFFKWLEFYNKENLLNLDRIRGQMDDRSVDVYAHYREEIDWYDSSKSKKIRELFYQMINEIE